MYNKSINFDIPDEETPAYVYIFLFLRDSDLRDNDMQLKMDKKRNAFGNLYYYAFLLLKMYCPYQHHVMTKMVILNQPNPLFQKTLTLTSIYFANSSSQCRNINP